MKSLLLRFALPVFALFVIFVGPWPVDDSHYSQTQYEKETKASIEQIQADARSGSLFTGIAQKEITPPPGVPLAGYSAREPKANIGSRESLFTRALTFSNGTKLVTLVSAEILLALPELVNAVVEKTGLDRKDIYFSSSHTHSGPGAYGSHIIEEIALGDFASNQLEFLSTAIADTILASRNNLLSTELVYQQVILEKRFAKTLVKSQLAPEEVHRTLHLLSIKRGHNPEDNATLITFSAHPTVLGRVNKRTSGDYPAFVTRKLSKEIPGLIAFSSGAVGGMLPATTSAERSNSLENQLSKLEEYSKRFANLVADVLKNNAREHDDVITRITQWQSNSLQIESEIISVELPYPNYRISDRLRLSPLLVNAIFHDNDTYIHAFRLGDIVFLGYPADYSGELATQIEQWANERNIYPWTTSFSGEYVGYLMPAKHYDRNHYLVRDANFFGRWAGEYFVDITRHTIQQLFPNKFAE